MYQPEKAHAGKTKPPQSNNIDDTAMDTKIFQMLQLFLHQRQAHIKINY